MTEDSSESETLVASTYIMPLLDIVTKKKEELQTLGFTDPDIEAIKDLLKKHWEDMDKAFNKVKAHSEENYRLNIRINKAIVVIGIILLSTSIAYSWIRGIDLFSAITSGIGVADFVALFLVNPQKSIRKVLGDLLQIQMIYRTWAIQVIGAVFRWIKNNDKDEEMEKLQNSLATFTRDAVELIEKNIGTDKND
ncbi:MAG: hypothetical protein HMLIMOIP_001082 [Candidatus Nitrosomirales archaeon]|jgi:hypothetical protein